MAQKAKAQSGKRIAARISFVLSVVIPATCQWSERCAMHVNGRKRQIERPPIGPLIRLV
jgi:hypothetical protein